MPDVKHILNKSSNSALENPWLSA